jgi:hypothetical protein
MIAPRDAVTNASEANASGALGGGRSRRTRAAVALAASVGAWAVRAAGCGRDDTRATRRADSAAHAAAEAAHDDVAELPPSVIDLPVVYDLDPAIAALERAVPSTVGNLDERRPIPGHGRLEYAFVAERSPFDVTVRGTRVTISSIVTYRARGWYKPPIGPSLSGSCGISGEAPRLQITLASTVRLGSDWKLSARTQVPAVVPVSAEARDKCRLTLLKLDVTARVLEAVRKQLEGKAALVDERVARLDVRQRVGRWWALVGRPIPIGKEAWLELRPEAVNLGRLRSGGGDVVAPLTITARPRIVTGPRPDSSTTPLPDIAPADSTRNGVQLALDAALDYDGATRLVAKQLVGRRFEKNGRAIVVHDARAFSAGHGRLALALGLTGDVAARVVLVGHPAYDSVTTMLTVPDLDFAVADASMLVRGADQLGHAALRDALRERARWPLGEIIDGARARAERAMNRELTRGVRLTATLTRGRALGVHAGDDALHVRAAVGGRLGLAVSRAPNVRRRSSPKPATTASTAPAPTGSTSAIARPGVPAPARAAGKSGPKPVPPRD